MKRIVDDPDRLKWCAGPCGRELPVTSFYKSTGGWPQSKCKACHRIYCKEQKRKQYRNDKKFRMADRARARAYYLAHVEERKAYRQAWYEARKLRAVAQAETPIHSSLYWRSMRKSA